VVLCQRLAQRCPPAHAPQHVGRDGAEPRAGREPFQDTEGPVERQARFEQGGQLLSERGQIAPWHPLAAEGGNPEPGERGALLLGGDMDGEVGVALEPFDHALRVGGFHDAVDGLAPLVCRLVRENGHASNARASCLPG
jgi:hypothetical protein